MTMVKTTNINKVLFLLLIFIFGAIVSTPPAQAAEELNVLTWCDHTDPGLLQPFEQKAWLYQL